MADPPPGTVCDHCDGRGWWASGCEGEVVCFQCHGSGAQRARGNCAMCLGWGLSIMGHACTTCSSTGWVDDAVALYWCAECLRTVDAAEAEPTCPRDAAHPLERLTVAERPTAG